MALTEEDVRRIVREEISAISDEVIETLEHLPGVAGVAEALDALLGINGTEAA